MTALDELTLDVGGLTIEHLDQGWAIACQRYPEHAPPPCDQVAEWIAWSVRCCPYRAPAVPLCSGHKDELVQGESGICAHCSTTFAPTRTGFTLIEPLNRRPQ